ncbi:MULTISPECIES: hypothetical protein [Salinibaculum]|uniref:hypothetical protein n=1 Tax=Salinibaculum TaxID=2732368 RepID=UPI0030D1D0FD
MTGEPTANDVDPYDHVRATDRSSVPSGVYRVVGTGDPVTLVRVTDAEGRRRHTGQVVSVPAATLSASFDPAENPDQGFAIRDLVAPFVTVPQAVAYWLRRLFP